MRAMSGASRRIGPAFVATSRAVQRVRDKAFSLLASGAFAQFGRSSVIQLPVRLSGEDRIRIGSGVFVGAGSWLQTLGDLPETRLEIGDGTSIAGSCVLSAAVDVRLGQNVLLARNVYISDHIHAYTDTERPVLSQGVEKLAPVVVEDGAWLGQGVVVCPGVRIGRGAVVGANAVVTKDVPAYTLAVGAPARIVREFGPEGERTDCPAASQR
jgi:acetyltransferase-like isoleucine patch superfamily enzyme